MGMNAEVKCDQLPVHNNFHLTNVAPRAVVEQVVTEYILPLPLSGSSSKGNDIDESSWTDRLLNTMKYLDEKAIKALLSLTGLKAQ